jgi:hypothetical protein
VKEKRKVAEISKDYGSQHDAETKFQCSVVL